jgi:hypothetical protein
LRPSAQSLLVVPCHLPNQEGRDRAFFEGHHFQPGARRLPALRLRSNPRL